MCALNSATGNEAGHRELRRQGGQWLKQMRENVGLSQKQLALQLEIEYHTLISQLECGIGRVPTHRYKDWAKAFELPVESFICDLLRYYDPDVHEILLGKRN
jgi:transcriptional regulator with XRE-family HTH domain